MIREDGFFYPSGGMISIARALQKIMGEYGGDLRLDSPVEKIIVEGGKATGVRLENGEEITARVVISNAHSRETYLKLLDAESLPYAIRRSVSRQPNSIPVPYVAMGLKVKMDCVRSHFSIILPERKQFDNFWNEFYDKGLLNYPPDGMFFASCPSFEDPTMAPEGKQVLDAFYIASPKLKYHQWDDISEEWSMSCIEFLDRTAFPGLGANVEVMDSVTPVEMERRLRLPEGGFFGLEMSFTNLGPFRPSYRSPCVDNLYLTGHTTNPGGSVPIVMISGIACSSLLLNDWPDIS
ncbi:MAG: NAD(P)/FAD-dependent oxidoreductase [Actinobacteria bacterium]|nr:NAD(P)/FAD-dependent oxidoreductase [Actinomycetota bacterium]